jgi:hypothetical protein
MISNFYPGVNLWQQGFGVNGGPGVAQDAQDVLIRPDGAVYKHWGWERINTTAFTATTHLIKGGVYKGKNSPNVRLGNFGLANDGANFTVRTPIYSTGIVLTDTELRIWNPATGVFDLPVAAYAGPVWLPPGVAIDPRKPQVLIYNNQFYIIGWADSNLRYDPTDRILYEWGWDVPCLNAGHAGVGAGGTLVANVTYRYRLSWIDLFTGEESPLSVVYEQTTTAANRTITLDNFTAYGVDEGGVRHYNDGANRANEDVGIVVYRTDPDGHEYFFLDIVNPDLTAATVTDNGLATDYSIKADTRALVDPPRLDAAVEWRDMWLGLSWDENIARVFYNDFKKVNSFWERRDVRDYVELPVEDGEMLMACAKTTRAPIIFSNTEGYELNMTPTASGAIVPSVQPLKWGVGAVGPKAWDYARGYLYFLSDIGPQRVAPGGWPQFIGEWVTPLFLDPTVGLCNMNEAARFLSEVLYDRDSETMRWIFPCGSAVTPNRHLIYHVRAEQKTGDYRTGWFPCSAQAQTMDYTNVFGPGVPPIDPIDRRGRLVFTDPFNYLNEYQPGFLRAGGPPAGTPATGLVGAGSTVNTLVTAAGGLFAVNDGMAGLRLHVIHTDNTIDLRTILSNTAANILPTAPFSQAPAAGATWYVGGIPAFWKSWHDHFGDPRAPKTNLHLHVGFMDQGADVILYCVVSAGDFMTGASRDFDFNLNAARDKVMVSATARWFSYEFTNSLPDEAFCVTWYWPDTGPVTPRKP